MPVPLSSDPEELKKRIEECSKKSQFQRKDRAEHYAIKYTKLRSEQLYVYQCPCCTMYHLTRTPQKTDETSRKL